MGDSHHQAAIVFSASLTRFLSTDEARLPPTYVGVRRVRPSSRIVRDALRKQSVVCDLPDNGCNANGCCSGIISDPDGANHPESSDGQMPSSLATNASILPPPDTPVYKTIGEDGVVRRMTKKEKKEVRNRLRKERYDAIKEMKRRATALAPATCQSADGPVEKEINEGGERAAPPQSTVQQPLPSHIDPANGQRRQYHTLDVNQAAIEEELAELRGDSSRIPPVVLSGSMVNQALRRGILKAGGAAQMAGPLDELDTSACIIDDNLGKVWANAIKDVMKVAEDVRSKEALRPMAYKVVPEVWSRLRPEGLLATDEVTPQAQEDTSSALSSAPAPTMSEEDRQCWSFIETRPPIHRFDDDISIVHDRIYRLSQLHVSCGSKFGCDLLLYDGSREERHAFAGLRVCSSSTGGEGVSLGTVHSVRDSDGSTIALPIPSAYDLAGYVRCLNTAGKLALLATVLRSERKGKQIMRVAFVDLALEKILSAPTHKKKRSGRKRSKQVRKGGDENLAKKR